MKPVLRDGTGFVLLVSALFVLFRGVLTFGRHDYVTALALVVVGLALLGAAMELLRPGLGE